MSAKKKGGLGKGLSALLDNSENDLSTNYSAGNFAAGTINKIKIEQIEVNPFNPRTNFEPEALEQLSNSIQEHGVIQPITVREVGSGKYQIISGERRFRASQLAGLKEVPAYVRSADDQTMLEMALVENIQREDLDAIEIAISYQRLIDECNLTQDGLSQKIGKSRASVTNYLRLLKLTADVQIAIRDKEISMGHARVLAGIADEDKQVTILKRIIKDDLSVRQVEQIARDSKKDKTPKSKSFDPSLSFEQQKIKTDLEEYLGTKIGVKQGSNGTGKIVISYASENDLKRIIDLLDF